METADGSQLKTFFLHNKLSVFLFLLSSLVLLAGVVGYLRFQSPEKDEVSFSIQEQATGSAVLSRQTEAKKTRVVDIAGAVNRPGVYELPADSRIKDVIVMAGGLSEYADTKQIATKLNLATKLSDGMKIYIPTLGEDVPASLQQSEAVSTRININTASLTELDSLSGIGKVTAEKIISNRPYLVIEDLVAKKVLSEKALAQIRDNIVAE